MTPRWATTGVFVVNGAAIGTWVAQIPWIQERFDLSKSAMGLVITGMAIAVILAFPIAGQAIVRHGSEKIVWVGGTACALAINLPVLAPAPVSSMLGLFVLGASSATQDVSMNSHGVKVEHDLGRPIMSSLHAGWAFGGMAGAAFSAGMTALGVDPRITVAIASAILLTLLYVSASRIGHGSAAEGDDTPGFTLPSRGVVLIAILCLLVMVTEGAMADWGGLYLRQDLGASAALAALAYSFFTAGMTVGRVAGDAINRRIGPVALLRWGALLTGIPLGAMLLIGHPAAALDRAVPRRPRRGERRPADVQRRGQPARHAARAGDRRRLVDGLARVPRRAADHRLPRRPDHAPVGARAADPRRRRRLRAGAPRRRRPARRADRPTRASRCPVP